MALGAKQNCKMKLILSILLLSISFKSLGQWGYKDEDIASRYKPGILWFNTGWRPAAEDKTRKYDRLIADVVYSLPQVNGLNQTVKGSFGWNINPMWDIPLTPGNTVSIGIGVSYRNARLGLTNIIQEDSTAKATTILDTSYSGVNKQVLGSHVFAVPLEIRFRAAKWKHFKFHLGGYFGYQPRMYNKLWYKENETMYVRKKLMDNNPLVYGVHMRMGFRNFALFADYRLSTSFKSDKSTELNFLTFGLSFSLF
jgi:hypothetical protein